MREEVCVVCVGAGAAPGTFALAMAAFFLALNFQLDLAGESLCSTGARVSPPFSWTVMGLRFEAAEPL